MNKCKYLAFMVTMLMFPASGILASTCKVPLKLVNVGTKTKPQYKLGINAGIGGGAPRLYEFDTGGKGFWAAYNGSLPSTRQWWGVNDVVSTGTLFNKYTSGNEYTANLVSANISLYNINSSNASDPVLCVTPTPVQFAQITQYQNSKSKKQNKVKAWNKALDTGKAPLEGNFWGDFGAALMQTMDNTGSYGVYTVLNQFQYQAQHNGFIVHVGSLVGKPDIAPYVQIGLDKKDIDSFPYKIRMNQVCPTSTTSTALCPLSTLFSSFPVATFSEQQFQAGLTINGKSAGDSQVLGSPIGITIDSGAPLATVYQMGNIAIAKKYLKKTSLSDGSSNPPIYSGDFKEGESVTLMSQDTIDGNLFSTTENNAIKPVHSRITAGYKGKNAPNGGIPYMNTGITFYSSWDVMFDVDSGLIGFRPSNASSGPSYGNKTVTIPVNNYSNGQFTGSPGIDVAFFNGKSFESSSPFTLDTGSTSVVVSCDVVMGKDKCTPGNRNQLLSQFFGRSLGKGSMFYSSAGRTQSGRWYLATLRLGTDTANAHARVPVLVVDTITCVKDARGCQPSNNPEGVRMMGVGFARENTSKAKNYDGKVASIPANNAMLNITAINGKPVIASAPDKPGSPRTIGNLTSGYIISPEGITIGLTEDNTAAFKRVNLSWSNHPKNGSFNSNWADWGTVPMQLTLNGTGGSGYVLTDTGIQYMMVEPLSGTQYSVDSSCSTSSFTSDQCLVNGSKVRLQIGDAVDYSFTVGQSSDAPAAAPPYAIIDGTSASTLFVNTGYHFFNQYAYVYDYVNGYVGYRDLLSQSRK